MRKTALKIFIGFTAVAVVTAMILLVINFFGLAITASDTRNLYPYSPNSLLSTISAEMKQTQDGWEIQNKDAVPPDTWCILIGDDGNVIWSERMPEDIPKQYSVRDVASMTRWFLNDYPVYVRCEEYGLLVLGYPKNSVGKYSVEYSMEWFDTLPDRLLALLLFNVLLAAALAAILGARLYKRLKQLADGIRKLNLEVPVTLKEKGLCRELARYINSTSQAIERKNTSLRKRDSARANWIAGISHDIRTPLSLVLGYAEELSYDACLTEEEREKLKRITAQSVRMKTLIEDLNLISSLEYDMQPAKRKPVRLCALLRQTVSDIINTGLPQNIQIELILRGENAVLSGDASLIGRAVFNLIQNSITHNPQGCRVTVEEDIDRERRMAWVMISDDGAGIPAETLAAIGEIPKTAHGLGLPMAYKIVSVHGGTFTAWNAHGFHVKMEFPAEQ